MRSCSRRYIGPYASTRPLVTLQTGRIWRAPLMQVRWCCRSGVVCVKRLQPELACKASPINWRSSWTLSRNDYNWEVREAGRRDYISRMIISWLTPDINWNKNVIFDEIFVSGSLEVVKWQLLVRSISSKWQHSVYAIRFHRAVSLYSTTYCSHPMSIR